MLTMMATYVSFLTSGLEQAVAQRLTAAKTGVQIQIRQHEQQLQEEILRHASHALLLRSAAQADRDGLDRLLPHFLGLSPARVIGLYDGRGEHVVSFQKAESGPTMAEAGRIGGPPVAGQMRPPGPGGVSAGDFVFDVTPGTDSFLTSSERQRIVVFQGADRIPPHIVDLLSAQGYAMTRTLFPDGLRITAYKALNFSGRMVGVLYEGLPLDQTFVDGLKETFGLEVAIVDPTGRAIKSSVADLSEFSRKGGTDGIEGATIGSRQFFSAALSLGRNVARDQGMIVLLEPQDVLRAAQRRAVVFFSVVFALLVGVVLLASVYLAQVLTRRQRATEDALEASRASFRNAVDKSAEGIIIVDIDRVIEFVNPCGTLMFADPSTVCPGQRFHHALAPNEPAEIPIVTPPGRQGVGEMLSVPTEWDGKPAFLISIRDITDRKHAEEIIQHQAYHDALTQLPNRLLFIDRLNQELSRQSWQKRPVAVAFLDLDQFKRINDTLGHSVGDALLRGVAERLRECLREGDTIARLGGDEFTLILTDLAKPDDVAEVAKKLLGSFSTPFYVEGRELFVTASIGISIYPTDGETAETLLKHADTAMYRAKDLGRNHFQLYVSSMNTRVSERLAIETGLRRALERNELRLVYQPQIDLKSNELIAVEVLLRWHRPDGETVPPSDFIPVAEETGLIVPIGEWVLRTACRQAVAWHVAGAIGLQVSVNISGRQFRHGGLVESIRTTLDTTGLDPRNLELELTESIIQNAEATIATLRELSEMNVQIAIDDFGTGYSSLSYLNRLPINKLKIDRSFMKDLPHHSDGCAIVSAIITLAHSLRLKAVAEGVELPEQMEFLRALDCDGVQGFLISKPLPAEALWAWVATNPRVRGFSPPQDRAA
jgi:diguanylate cyclase (GGDEF)-like protein